MDNGKGEKGRVPRPHKGPLQEHLYLFSNGSALSKQWFTTSASYDTLQRQKLGIFYAAICMLYLNTCEAHLCNIISHFNNLSQQHKCLVTHRMQS